MSTKSPVYPLYAIETEPPLCQHRKIPQHIQTIYCQEKPIRLEERTHLKKIGETFSPLTENLWKSDLHKEYFYKNKKDLEASIFALETRNDFKTLIVSEKFPQKSLNLMDKFRQSYRNSKKFWLKTKALEAEQSLTWIMKPLKKIKMSDMELAKKLKEKVLKEESYKCFKSKGIKSSRAKGIQRQQVKPFLEKCKLESTEFLFKAKCQNDSKSSFLNKLELQENKAKFKSFFNKSSTQDNEDIKDPEKQFSCDSINSKEKIIKSSLTKPKNKIENYLNKIKSSAGSKSFFDETKNKYKNQRNLIKAVNLKCSSKSSQAYKNKIKPKDKYLKQLKIAEKTKSSSGSECLADFKSSDKSKDCITYKKIKTRDKNSLKQKENIKSSSTSNKSSFGHKKMNAIKLKSNEKDKHIRNRNQSLPDKSSLLQMKTKELDKIILKNDNKAKSLQISNKNSLESKSSERSKSSLINIKGKEGNKKHIENVNNAKSYKNINQSSKESKSSEKTISLTKSKEMLEKCLKSDDNDKSFKNKNQSLQHTKSLEGSKSCLLNTNIKESNKKTLESSLNKIKDSKKCKSSQGSKSSMNSMTIIDIKSLEETKRCQGGEELTLEQKNKVKSNLTPKNKPNQESSLQQKNDSQLENILVDSKHHELKELKDNTFLEESLNQNENHLELKSFSEAKLHLREYLQNNKFDKEPKNTLSKEKLQQNSDLKPKSSCTIQKAKETKYEGTKSLLAGECEIANIKSLSKTLSREKNLNGTDPTIKPSSRKKTQNFKNPLPQTNSVLIHYIRNITNTEAFKSSQNQKQKEVLENKEDLKNSKNSGTISKKLENKSNESFVAKTQTKERKKEKHFKKSLAKVNKRKSLTKSNSSLHGKLSLVQPIVQKYPKYMRPQYYTEDIYKDPNKILEGKSQFISSKCLRKNPKFNLTNDFICQDSKAFNDSSVSKLYKAKDLANEQKVCTSSCYSKTLEVLTNLGKPKQKPKILFEKLHLEFAKDPLKVLENVGIQVLKTKQLKAISMQNKKKL